MKFYESPIRIRFAHCDPAGIVFHPRYFDMLNALMEDFLRDVLEMNFVNMQRYGVGLPVAGIHCDFMAPGHVGDLCTGRIWIERMGKSSIRFAMTISLGEEMRLRCTETSVCVRAKEDGGLEPAPIPEEIRTRLSPYLMESESETLQFRS